MTNFYGIGSFGTGLCKDLSTTDTIYDACAIDQTMSLIALGMFILACFGFYVVYREYNKWRRR